MASTQCSCRSINVIKKEAYQSIQERSLHRQQPIYNLCNYIVVCRWTEVECELEEHDYLLRNRCIYLPGKRFIYLIYLELRRWLSRLWNNFKKINGY
ncbi:MAG: DUF4327 family protein [cyanobacterium endosymbiont of Rhopalodia gibba]